MRSKESRSVRQWNVVFAIGGLTFVVVAGAVWGWWETRDRLLSERPQRVARALSLPKQTSSINVSASLPVSAIVNLLNSSAPVTFSGKGRQKVCAELTEQIKKTIHKTIGGDVGKFLGEVTKILTEIVTLNQAREVCQDVDFHYDVKREGAFQIEPLSNRLRLTTPISINGQAGFTGDLAKALALDKKNFRGDLTLIADVSADIDADWCPIINASTTFVWTNKAQFEIVHKWWINIDDQVGPELQAALDKATDALRSSFGCEDVKQAVSPFWRPYEIPFIIPGDDQATATLSLTPTRIGFSSIRYTPDQLSLALGLEAETEVVSGAVVPKSGTFELPALERIDANGNTVRIATPIRLRYEHLSAAMSKHLIEAPFETETAGGRVKVFVDELEFYPSGEKLAVAVHFSARTTSHLFDSKGWFFLLAEPRLDEASQVISLADIEFSRKLDNPLWSVFSALFYDQIRSRLETEARFDLKPRITDLRNRLQQALADLAEQEKVAISIDDTFVGLQGFSLAEQTFEVAVALEGNAHIALGAIPIQ